MLRSTLRATARARIVRAVPRRLLATEGASAAAPTKSGLRSALVSTGLLALTGAGLYYAHDSQAGIHRWLLLPAVAQLTANDPEAAHELAVKVIASGFAPIDRGVDDERLAIDLFGKSYSNPIGIAAGFDKHGEAIDGLFKLGFGYVELGSVAPEPQAGNPKPRVFRVRETKSLVNRYGFNSEGHEAVLARLRARVVAFVKSTAAALPPSLFPTPDPHDPASYDVTSALLSSPAGLDARVPDALALPRSLRPGQVLGINLGKNKASDPDSIADFVDGVTTLGPYADVLVINVSSPNTPGLRALQRRGMVEELLSCVLAARNNLPGTVRPPVLVKIAPDLDDAQLEDVAAAVLASGADGIIVSNTTISRPSSAGTSPSLAETGGLSGPPVKPLALKALAKLYEATEGKVPLIGCGGIATGADAVEFARAGASLVQMYTAMVYDGFGLPRRIKDEVTEILRTEDTTWKALVGSSAREAKAVAERKARAEAAVRAAEPVKGPVDFEAGLVEAQQELEALLVQLAEVEAPLPPLDAPTPVAVPALVAESIPTSFPTPPTEVVEAITVEPNAVEPIAVEHVAVPANAILNDDAIPVLLDPAQAQVDAGLVVTPIEAEAPKVEDPLKTSGGKRWV